jgi:hypothetical protein
MQTARWLVLAPALVFAALVAAPPLNHDAAGILSFAERWVAGERLYVDLLDVNPPLVFVLFAGPAWLAGALGLDPVAVLKAALAGMVLGCWALAWAVRDRAAEGRVERALLDVLPPLLGFGAGYDLGQRETMMATLALPYLLAAARRAEGGRPRAGLAAGLVAAVGFALKPHFLLVPVLVEAAVLARRGRAGLRDPVPWAMAGLWLAYLASLPLLFPAYLGAVVPMALALYVDNGGRGVLDVLGQARLWPVALVLAGLAVAAFRGRAMLPRVLALAAVAGLAAALAQRKGWPYHFMPVQLFTLALAAVLGARWLDRPGTRSVGAPGGWAAGLAGGFALALMGLGAAPRSQLTWHGTDAYALAGMLRAHAGGGRVLALSPLIAPIYPALNYARARMTLPAMNTWMLEGAYRTCPADGARWREPAQMGAEERFLFERVAADFAREPPEAVLVDKFAAIPDCGGVAFDLLGYFARHPLFAAAWPRYEAVARRGRFTVYARRD